MRTVVKRGGRPDLAAGGLAQVACPTLLLMGSLDDTELELNRQAADQPGGPWQLQVVPGASNLFEEPGGLEQVGSRGGAWLSAVLTADQATKRP